MITVINAFAPAGGFAGTTQSTNAFVPISTAVASPAFYSVSYLEVQAGAAGAVDLSAPLVFTIPFGSDEGSYTLRLQWRRWNGSTWVNVGPTHIETLQAYYSTFFSFGGTIDALHSDTGLTPGTLYRYHLFAWATNYLGRYRILEGTATAAGR